MQEQWEEFEQSQDTIQRRYDPGQVRLPDPSFIRESYSYNPVTQRYYYARGFDSYDISLPAILTKEEFEQLVIRAEIRKYFQMKFDAMHGRLDDEEALRDMLPRYYVNSKLFEGIFGSNTIDVKPSGSVEFDMGIRLTKQENPVISPRNRRNMMFDFDQRISMGLHGMVGTRMGVNINYDTQSTFDFQNMMKLAYEPDEDAIIKKIEVGNVSMPISGSLIRGAHSLFGVRTELQFGRTTISGVFSEQKSETSTVVAQGAGTLEDFELYALDYDEDRHFFLSQYFRNNYDKSLQNYPYINSRVRITRVEVWVTNRYSRMGSTNNNSRNLIVIQDLGEGKNPKGNGDRVVSNSDPNFFVNSASNAYPDNGNNLYDPNKIGVAGYFLNSAIRNSTSGTQGFNVPVQEGRDFVKLESARKLNSNEYTYHTQLGYISLNQRLSNDEVLAVAFQYTVGDKVYQVGEFGTDTQVAPENSGSVTPGNDNVLLSQGIVVKMLKSSLTLTHAPVWNLMMKNIYQIPNASYVTAEKFRFNILYTDPSPLNYISSVDGNALPEGVERTPLLNVFHLDQLNSVNDPQKGGDGFFDFLPNGNLQNIYDPNNPTSSFTGNNNNSGYGSGYGGNNGFGSNGNLNNNQGYGSNPGYGNSNYGSSGNNSNRNSFDGITIDAVNGRIIFTTVEPFGQYLFQKLDESALGGNSDDYYNEASYNANQKKYVFAELYRSTKSTAIRNQSSKNKFLLKGKFSSQNGEGIPIGAYNVAQGSVVVKAAGRVLVEGIDYTVDYNRGRVMILDPSLQGSNTPIEVSVENNTMFGQQTKRFFGLNVEHKISEDLIFGGTFLRLSERPMTHKSTYGQEAVNNTIWGLHAQYSTEVPFLTRMVNKLPNIDTDVESRVSLRGEFAYLKPGSSKIDQMNGEATSYLDDFEAAQSNIDIKGSLAWKLASVPLGFFTEQSTDAENTIGNYSLVDGFRRAKLSWYMIDPTFYVGSRPNGVDEYDLNSSKTRRIYSEELFPTKDIAYGESRVINTLDLTYYPSIRGPYNFNPKYRNTNGSSNLDSSRNWAGIMRGLNATNFEQSNIEFVQFWMMDPFVGTSVDRFSNEYLTDKGEVRFNFGLISEDVLRDGYKQYENGLPGSSQNPVTTIETIWGRVPAAPSLIYAFDVDALSRELQDVGLDGLDDDQERIWFKDFAHLQDPAGDNFVHYLDAQGGIIERYFNYNGTQGNSPVSGSRGGDNLPDTEDIDSDNTMNTINAYLEYAIPVHANLKVGDPYVVDVREEQAQLADGKLERVRWIQFKIPIDKNGKAKGDIANMGGSDDASFEDLIRSMRFMRIYMTGFKTQITLRFATLDLVRSNWRRSDRDMQIGSNGQLPDESQPEKISNTGFDVSAVNTQDNFDRKPIPYVTPPGVRREQAYINNTLINQNEQSLSIRLYPKNANAQPNGLRPGDARGVYKGFNVDMRQYKKLRMFVHAESLAESSSKRLLDDQAYAFIRLGSDITDNYYQVRIPLKVTNPGASTPEEIWPEINEFLVDLDLLTKIKIQKMNDQQQSGSTNNGINIFYEKSAEDLGGDRPDMYVGIKGNPNFANVRMMMLGIRNESLTDLAGEFWFDELRLSDMDNKGGWAATASIDANIADFATISATGMRSTSGFGALEQGPEQRSKEDYKSYSLVTNVNLGHLLPKKWGVVVPFNYAVSEEVVTPEYDPGNLDLKLSLVKSNAKSSAQAEAIEKRAIDYTKRKSINFIGVTKQRNSDRKPTPIDVENFTVSHSYNETKHHDYEIESMLEQQVRTSLDYAYSFSPKVVEPLKKVGFLQNEYFALFRDFNFNYLPSNINFSSNILRQFNRQQFRLIEVQGIGLDPLYRRNYFFNYNYGFNFDLTRSLRLTYVGGSNNVVKNYYESKTGIVDNNNTIWDDYFDIGTPNQFTQQLNLTYDLPFDKIPFLSFIRSSYNFTGTYNWQKASESFSQVELEGRFYSLGNTIQNSRTQALNTSFSMEALYRYIGLVKTDRSRQNRVNNNTKKAAIVPGQKVVQTNPVTQNKESVAGKFKDVFIGLITSIKNIQINYSENSGTMLPGFMPDVGFFGTSKPTLGFIFGGQSDVRQIAAQGGYLTDFPNLSDPFLQISNKTLNINATLMPIPDLIIDVFAMRSKSDNFSEQFTVSDYNYISLAPYNYGNFNISTNLLATSFSSSSLNSSAAFDKMLDNRLVIANRLALQDGIDILNPANLDQNGYPIGYSSKSQAVILPAFLAAYSGSNASSVSTGMFRDMPLPNWNLKYNGFMKIGFIRENFRRFSVSHGYQATYSLGSYTTNIAFYDKDDSNDLTKDKPVKDIINNATLYEQFNPLVRIDLETRSAIRFLAEVRKDRMLSLSFDNNSLTETHGQDFILGLGYRIKDVGFNSSYANNGMGGRISSDVNIKADITLSKRETLIRYLDYQNNQMGGGQNTWSLRLTADYMLSQNLTAIFFYDHSFSKAIISTMYPITNIRTGITIRYNFGN
ncbi:T9SS outer membrane translocon Sov/SprA [Myroides sp. LJL119]